MLKYNFEPFDRAYTFQILEQSESLSDFVKYWGPIRTSNGWTVKIDAEPEVDDKAKEIYLRGSKSKSDTRIDKTWDLPSNAYRDFVAREVREALVETISLAKSYNDAFSMRVSKKNPYANVNQLPSERVKTYSYVAVLPYTFSDKYVVTL
jgi:hypothetical protein